MVAARRVAGFGAAPILRGHIARASHAERFAWARRLIPGSLAQLPEEIIGFGELAASRSPATVCEIGTLFGGTSLFLCGLSPSMRVFAGIDIKLRNSQLVSALAPRDVSVTFLEGTTRDPVVRRRLEATLGSSPLDLLFIDGDHAYEGARADLNEYRDLVRPGGLIAFHDIVRDRGLGNGPAGPNRPGGVPGSNWSGGVPDLWEELRGRFRHWEVVRDRDQNGFGIGVIENDPATDPI